MPFSMGQMLATYIIMHSPFILFLKGDAKGYCISFVQYGNEVMSFDRQNLNLW